MTRFEWLKFAHVLLAVIWIGGSIVGNILASRAAKADQKHRLGFVEDVTALSDRVFAPAAIGTLVFGVLMVLDTDSLSFGDTWILIGLGGVLTSLVLAIGVMGPIMKRMSAELESGGTGVEPLTSIVRLTHLENVVLLVVVWVMVTKPGL